MDAIIGKGKAPSAPAGAAPAIKEGSTSSFMADVIDASAEAAIVVDFWAPWCGPCKQLGPALEKAVRESKGAVRLVKINVDENQELAQQMRIQSIPAVYAFKDGRPVDGFVGALPEAQVKQFVQRLASLPGGAPSPIADALELAQQAHQAGDLARAVNIWSQVLQMEPQNVAALAGLARAALAQKDVKRARDYLARVPAGEAAHPEIAAVRAALDLAEAGQKASGETAALEARIAANPADHQARLDLATALFATGQRETAIDHLVDSIKRDRNWNEGAARKQLLKLIEAMGPADPLTATARRRLSSILFS